MRYLRTITVLLVMFGVTACGGSDDATKKGGDDDMVVINTDDGSQSNDDDSRSNDDNVVVVTDGEDDTGDDGNTRTASPDRPDQVCGDGILHADEACDDSNAESGDGCSKSCEIETVILRNLQAVLEDTSSCYQERCDARYRVTLTLQNFTEEWVERVTNMRLDLGGQEISTGGVTCDANQWQVAPQSRTEIIDLMIYYVEYEDRWRAEFTCTANYDDQRFYADDTTASNYVEDGQLVFEITGLLEDGSVWTTSATSELRDFR